MKELAVLAFVALVCVGFGVLIVVAALRWMAHWFDDDSPSSVERCVCGNAKPRGAPGCPHASAYLPEIVLSSPRIGDRTYRCQCCGHEHPVGEVCGEWIEVEE